MSALSPQEQLKTLCSVIKKMEVSAIGVLRCLLPSEDVPNKVRDVVLALDAAPGVIKEWKLSAARQGACVAWTLAKSHHPNLDVATVSKGLPRKHQDGRPFTDRDRELIGSQIRSYATRAANYAKIDLYFPATKCP